MSKELDLELYKIFIKKIQKINLESKNELSYIAETIFLNFNDNKELMDVGFKLLEIAEKLTIYRMEENE